MTIVLRPPLIYDPLNALPILGALAAAKAINTYTGLGAMVRWPNDIVVNHRKLAGVLVEAKFIGAKLEYTLLGIGINANFHMDMIGELGATSTSLLDLLGLAVDRGQLICSVLLETENLLEVASASREDDAMRMLRQCDCSRGKRVKIEVEGELIVGVFEDYESLTMVRIRLQDGSSKSIETGSASKVDYVDL